MTTVSTQKKPRVPAAADDPVASRIRARRLALGWSLKRLSEATGGLAPSFLFNIENSRKVPSEDVAARIANAIDDGAYESTYRAWARAKSRGRLGRIDHDALLAAWEQLRNPFGEGLSIVPTPSSAGNPSRDAMRLRVPVLAMPVDPGDGVRPPAERIINTLSLDPAIYGHDTSLARERYERLRRPFAFALDDQQADRVRLPGGTLAIVSREPLDAIQPRAAYVVRCDGRLEVVTGAMLNDGPVPGELVAAGLATSQALREAYVGRVDLLLPDVRQ